MLKMLNSTEYTGQERLWHTVQTLEKIWVSAWKNTELLLSTLWLLFQAHIFQHSQQHKESDHHSDQHTIYKMSQGNQCPTLPCWCFSGIWTLQQSVLIQTHNFFIKMPWIKWKSWSKVTAAKSLLQKPKADISYCPAELILQSKLYKCWHTEYIQYIGDISDLMYYLYILL